MLLLTSDYSSRRHQENERKRGKGVGGNEEKEISASFLQSHPGSGRVSR